MIGLFSTVQPPSRLWVLYSTYHRTPNTPHFLLASCDLVTTSVGTLRFDPCTLHLAPYSQKKTRLGLSLARRHLKSPHWDSHTSSVRTLSSLSTFKSLPSRSKRQSSTLSLLPTFVRVHTDYKPGLYQGFRLSTYRPLRHYWSLPGLLPRYHGTFFYTAGVLLHCPSTWAFLLSFPRRAHCPLPVQEPILQFTASRSFFRGLDLYHFFPCPPLLYNIPRAGSLPPTNNGCRSWFPLRVVNELYLYNSTHSFTPLPRTRFYPRQEARQFT